MMGQGQKAPSMPTRITEASRSVDSLYENRVENNERMLQRVKASDDPDLDAASWSKTLADLAMPALEGPFYSLSEVHATPRLVPLFPIWEHHMGAKERSCRNIVDLKDGEQNESASSTQTHIPADTDRVIVLAGALQKRWPEQALKGGTSDFASAYNQETACPHQAHLITIAQYDPIKMLIAFFLPLTQVFGARLAGLNFGRCANIGVYLLATLFAAPADHCVDDVITLERARFAHLVWRCWRRLAHLLGWNIPDEKSPEPSDLFKAIGVLVNLSLLPFGEAEIDILEDRAELILNKIDSILQSGHLYSGAAGSLVGVLGFMTGQRYRQHRPASSKQR